MNRRCMLITLLLCVLRTSSSGLSDDLTDDDYDGNYDEITSQSAEIDPSNLSSLTTTDDMNGPSIDPTIDTTTIFSTIFTTPSTTTATGEPVKSTTESIAQKCPKNCKCSDDQVDCSHQNLIQIPKTLPLNTALLNLSHNNLAALNVTDLISYSQLRQLILNDNHIEKIIYTEAFIKLPGLHHIDLTRNALKPLQGTEFLKARGLATLILAGNKDVVEPNVAIVHTPKLKTLNLSNCSITELSDNIFQNLSTLVALYLEDNPLDGDFNVNAFKNLVNLRTLHIPKVSKETAPKLCESLDIMDMVQLTAETYDLSCFMLSSGSSFDESTVRIGQTTLLADIDSNDLYKTLTNAPPSKTITTQKSVDPTKKVGSKGVEHPKIQSQQQVSPISQNETKIEHTTNSTQQADEMEEAKVNLPLEMIYIILAVVIAVTLVALVIGLICRMDCCGIKTKCCRRTHNRAATEDRGPRPHEEIPLNKVV